MNALAGQRIIAHNEYENRNGNKWVNKLTEHRRKSVKRDANEGTYHLRPKETHRQIRLHEFGMSVQMGKDWHPRSAHESGDYSVEYDRRPLICDIVIAERAREHAGRKWNQSGRADDAEIDPIEY